jgi:dihydrodipicolinate synthase/N-acetylneuraminate lyase
MRPFGAREIRGTYATVLLPITADDRIDFALLADELGVIATSGVDGAYSNGTAGEFYSLSEDEFTRINELVAQTCEATGLPFQLGGSFPTPQLALERIRRAADCHPTAIQVILPDWYPPTLEESIAFLDRAAEVANGIPLILYNPPHAKRVLTPEDLLAVCERIPALVGFKLGGGDDTWYLRMEPVLARASVFVPGHALATGHRHGAAGSYSNVACLQPRGATRWNRLMETDLEQALLQERAIQSFMTRHILPFRERLGHSNMALDKLLAGIGNWATIGTRLRWPYRGVDEIAAAALGPVARRELPFLFAEELSAPEPLQAAEGTP